jgi:hypothetical protein
MNSVVRELIVLVGSAASKNGGEIATVSRLQTTPTTEAKPRGSVIKKTPTTPAAKQFPLDESEKDFSDFGKAA